MIKEEKYGMSAEPFSELSEVASNIDAQNLMVVDRIVRSFFRQNRESIQAAYKTKRDQHSLHYAVVLKKDSLKMRNTILSFFERYDLSKYSAKYPVYFQFIPATSITKMGALEKLDIS